MSIWESLKQRLHSTPAQKKAEFHSTSFSQEFINEFIKTAATLDMSCGEVVEELQKLEDAAAERN